MSAPLYYPFGGLGLARRLESAEARDAEQFAQVWLRRYPGESGAVLDIAGGKAAFAGVGSPLSHAVGIAVGQAVSAAEFEELEAFYYSRGAVPVVDLCPLADPTLNEHLGRKGYRITEFNNVLVRPLNAEFRYENEAIQRAEDEFTWAKTVSTGFFEKEVFTHEELELTALIFQMAAGTPWLATVAGEPAAAAGMAMQDKLALLFGDSTIPRFRKRGLQSALIQARLSYAAAQGCDLATASTLPGTVSQANYEKLGFRLVYTKLILTRD